MKINEIFYSIQGEGKWTGLPNVFIRTTGCNLRCLYCDTKYAYYDGFDMEIEEIVKKIRAYQCKYICITGGEPLIQNDIFLLIDSLLDENYQICLETNGSKKIDKLTDKDNLLISMDIKCPSSKIHEKMIFENLTILRRNDQVKCIIYDKKDYNYIKNIIHKYKPQCVIYFQPVWGNNPKKLAYWIKNDKLDVRLGLQLHKIIWGEKKGI
jgi:7-carboxy-7-deazaguanine synthase